MARVEVWGRPNTFQWVPDGHPANPNNHNHALHVCKPGCAKYKAPYAQPAAALDPEWDALGQALNAEAA